MLLNDSYNHKEVNRKIIESVGRSFGIFDRIKMKGNGSPRLLISESCTEIQERLNKDNNVNWCYIELRPQGIILRFRSILETFALVIPYWKLVLYKTDADKYTLYKDQFFVRVMVKTQADHDFMTRVLEIKSAKAPESNP